MKLYKILFYLPVILYFIAGLIIIASIANGYKEGYINIFMNKNMLVGLLFIGVSYYIYLRAKSIIILINKLKEMKLKQKNHRSIIKFLFFEYIFIAMCTLFGMILLSAIISRAFLENYSIFD